MLSVNSFDWIFFDCFNTLIDDFDQSGYEAGLMPMYEVPVEAGLYDCSEAFRQDYHRWRQQYISGHAVEQSIQSRLRNVLETNRPQAPADLLSDLVDTMTERFAVAYPKTLRLPAGVEAMLTYWQGKVRLGVVSNFFLADWPDQFLAAYGLRPYLEFVVDSAACGWRKPGPEIYQTALQLAGSPPPGRVLFIGDHLKNDVLAPTELGMQAIHFDRSQDRPGAMTATNGVPSIRHWDQFR